MAKKLSSKNTKAFQKSLLTTASPPYTTIDGVSGANAISALWRQHIENLFTPVLTESYQAGNVEDVSTIKTHEVYQVKNVSVHRSTRMDCVFAEHLMLASQRLVPLLALVFQTPWSQCCWSPTSRMQLYLIARYWHILKWSRLNYFVCCVFSWRKQDMTVSALKHIHC